MESLYEKLGGEAAVNAAVELFYNKVLNDPHIQHFFEHTDMKRQRAMQKAFLTFAFGGVPSYGGRSLRDAHAPLVERGLNESHFDAVVEHLRQTLKELGVTDELTEEAVMFTNSVRDEGLGRGRQQ